MATICAQRFGSNIVRRTNCASFVRSFSQQAPKASLLRPNVARLASQSKPVNPIGIQARNFSNSQVAMLEGKMKALVYEEHNKPAIQERPIPQLRDVGDAIVKMKHSTICGTDLHILKGKVPTCKPGTILGHEGIGEVVETGPAVTGFKKGDTVLIACVSKCGICPSCSRGLPSHCHTGGWILGNQIDGTQAEYVRLPHASASMYHIPPSVATNDALLLSDALPTAMEAGTINGNVGPGKTVAVVGAGPVGLSVIMTAKIYTPAELLAIDLDDNRLKQAQEMGATNIANSGQMSADEIRAKFTEGKGFDCVIEAVGSPVTFELAQKLAGIGSDMANLGVHGASVPFHLNELWDRNLTFRTKLVDATSIPVLLELAKRHLIKAHKLISHTFSWYDILKAYSVFGNAAENKALKMRIDFPEGKN